MNFYGYQQPEILAKQVMHTKTIQEVEKLLKIFRLPFVVLTTIRKTSIIKKVIEEKMSSE